MPLITSPFALPATLAAKADPALIAEDERFFQDLAASLAASVHALTEELDEVRRRRAGAGSAAVERDLEVRRLASRLRTLRRFGLDLCLGRMVPADGSAPAWIGRLGVTAPDGRRLLLDWRSPAAEPFFGATHGRPMGLASRRRYRWVAGRIADYWDEVFTEEGLERSAALDDRSAFLASLGERRTGRMRDVLGTIQADQDAVIRAGSRGALVVDGGPGTGKTVVALHRAAYLLHAEPVLRERGLLSVGPSGPYLAYVDDVLPSLGEDSVVPCTLADLVPEGALAASEADPEIARLKGSTRVLEAVEAAVRGYEQPPARELVVETPWFDAVLTPADWVDAFAAPEPGLPHNEAREQVWDELLEILLDRCDADEDALRPTVRRWLRQDEDLRRAVDKAWPTLDPVGVVADLYAVPAHLARCAPGLTPEERVSLHRPDARAWTRSDLPILDAARARIGDPLAARRRRLREAAVAARRERMATVVDDLIAADDSEMAVMSILRRPDARNSLDDEAEQPADEPEPLSGPFGHIVVDEAQELTDAEWRMLLRRCPSRSMTVVGDRAQARHGFTEPWESRLARVGLRDVRVATLHVNYRTPSEVMAAAEPLIRAAIPDAEVPVSVRRSGVPVRRGKASELEDVLDGWLGAHPEGTACVIGATPARPRSRVHTLTPEEAKGLEFDLVVLVEPAALGGGIEGAVDRYVAMTRATSELVVLGA